MKKYSLFIFILSFCLFSCKKELLVPNNGIYRGVFMEIYNESDTVSSGVVYLALWEESSSFQMVGDSLTGAPASHGGTFVVQDASRIIYSNTSGFSGQYDVDHYLDTTYKYVFDDENYEFSFQNGETLYQYKLARN